MTVTVHLYFGEGRHLEFSYPDTLMFELNEATESFPEKVKAEMENPLLHPGFC